MMDIKQVIGAAALALVSSAALATPQYNGNTYGSEPSAPIANGAGYYLWNDVTSPSDWHLRWTGVGAPEADNVIEWAGNITFRDSNLGTTSTYLFEIGGTYGDTLSVDYDAPGLSFADNFYWESATNATGGVDGIDFSITGDIELMQLSLGSSLFDGLALTTDDPGVTATQVYIGSGYELPNVLVVENAGMTYQQFEIKVPEPSSVLLLGLGLVGLGVARRKQAKA